MCMCVCTFQCLSVMTHMCERRGQKRTLGVCLSLTFTLFETVCFVVMSKDSGSLC